MGRQSNFSRRAIHIEGDPEAAFHVAEALGLTQDQEQMLLIRMPKPGESLAPGEKPTVNVIFPLPDDFTYGQYARVSEVLATDPRLVDRNGEPLFSGNTQLSHPDGRQEFYANSYYNQLANNLTPEDFVHDVRAQNAVMAEILAKHGLPTDYELRNAGTQVYERSADHPKDYLSQVLREAQNDRGTETSPNTGT